MPLAHPELHGQARVRTAVLGIRGQLAGRLGARRLLIGALALVLHPDPESLARRLAEPVPLVVRQVAELAPAALGAFVLEEEAARTALPDVVQTGADREAVCELLRDGMAG